MKPDDAMEALNSAPDEALWLINAHAARSMQLRAVEVLDHHVTLGQKVYVFQSLNVYIHLHLTWQ